MNYFDWSEWYYFFKFLLQDKRLSKQHEEEKNIERITEQSHVSCDRAEHGSDST